MASSRLVVVVVADDRDSRRERVLAVIYEMRGPDGLRKEPVGRVTFGDALDELAALEAPTTNEAARRAYQARVAERARRRAES